VDETSRRASATGPSGGSGERPPRRWPWVALRMIVAGALLSVPIVPLAFFLIPVPADADGVTICLPALGPLRQYSDDLSPGDRAAVRVHEAVHADQCRELGAVEYARTYLDAEGRLGLEAEAYCAEVAVLGLRGEDPVRVVDRTVETLFTEYRHDPDRGDSLRTRGRHPGVARLARRRSAPPRRRSAPEQPDRARSRVELDRAPSVPESALDVIPPHRPHLER